MQCNQGNQSTSIINIRRQPLRLRHSRNLVPNNQSHLSRTNLAASTNNPFEYNTNMRIRAFYSNQFREPKVVEWSLIVILDFLSASVPIFSIGLLPCLCPSRLYFAPFGVLLLERGEARNYLDEEKLLLTEHSEGLTLLENKIVVDGRRAYSWTHLNLKVRPSNKSGIGEGETGTPGAQNIQTWNFSTQIWTATNPSRTVDKYDQISGKNIESTKGWCWG